MRKQIGTMLILLAIGVGAMAQNDRDAFRYAQYSPTGTARYSALSGATGAFGSDFSCLSAGNPAGIGLFKRAEFTITPAISGNRITTIYNGEKQKQPKSNFNVNNLGFVIAAALDTTTGWRYIQLATGLNNLARYDGLSVAAGQNEGGATFFDYVASATNGTKYYSLSDAFGTDFFPSGFVLDAFDRYLIDTIGGDDKYWGVNANLNQQQRKRTSGYLNEYIISFGGNYDDKLFLGATLGIPFFRYTQTVTYTESSNPYYDTLILVDRFNESATGINLKLGIIYQPVKYLRLGAAFHTPTLYPNVKTTYQKTIDVWMPENSDYSDIGCGYDDKGAFNYTLRTPYHAMANIAFIYKQLGFINIDYEYVDYTVSYLQSDSYNFLTENENISQYYKGTHTIRAGAELNISPLVLRVGGSYSTNPYTKEIEKDGSRYTVSGGIGIKKKAFFIDFAYMYRFYKDKDIFYDHASLNPYTMDLTNQVFALTIGWKMKM
jgi:hypothetical protein